MKDGQRQELEKQLRYLECNQCPRLKYIPNEFNLTDLTVGECYNLSKISGSLNKLEKLNIDCNNKISSIPNLSNLKDLSISDCPNITKIPSSLNKIELIHMIYQKIIHFI